MNILDDIVRKGVRWQECHNSFGCDILEGADGLITKCKI